MFGGFTVYCVCARVRCITETSVWNLWNGEGRTERLRECVRWRVKRENTGQSTHFAFLTSQYFFRDSTNCGAWYVCYLRTHSYLRLHLHYKFIDSVHKNLLEECARTQMQLVGQQNLLISIPAWRAIKCASHRIG